MNTGTWPSRSGGLKVEKTKYDYVSRGAQNRKRLSGEVHQTLYFQTRPLIRGGVLHEQTRNRIKIILTERRNNRK
jgi:hypothetical protein